MSSNNFLIAQARLEFFIAAIREEFNYDVKYVVCVMVITVLTVIPLHLVFLSYTVGTGILSTVILTE